MNNNHTNDINDYIKTVTTSITSLNLETITTLITSMEKVRDNDKTLYLFGNGGSGATASHCCGDIIKGLSFSNTKRFKAICLNDNIPGMMAISNDISYDDIFVEPLKNFASQGDLVIGFSGSGQSKNIIKALQYAKDNHIETACFCGFNGGKAKEMVDIPIHVPVMDMEASEDAHMIIFHAIKKVFMKKHT